MFDVTNVNLHFGGRHILKDASFKVEDGERAAIIGPNGAGKSTLLKTIAGIIKPETGGVSFPKTTQIGYLPQEIIIDTDETVEEECRKVFQVLLDHEQEMRDLEQRMAEVTDHSSKEYDRIVERYDFLLHETIRHDLHSMDATIGKIMSGLGFKPEELRKPCRQFSGGWQMRIALGKLLLMNPDILLLDEPTNHLDIETIDWLGEWLQTHEGSVLMVSHERSFMDSLVNKVVEIDRGKVVVYRGNYTESLQKRDERREMQRRAYENQQIELAQIQKFIDRFRYQASKASLVQSRVKQLEKMEIIDAPTAEQGTIHFRFPPAPRSGKEVVVAEGLAKRFGKTEVFRDVDFTLYRGEKVALVGVNGAGKTTLMRILAGKYNAEAGRVTYGSNVEMEYFAQYDYEDLHPNNNVLGEFLSKAPLSISDRARDILGAFLFSGDDVDKKVSVLSGGEKTRLRLARMLCGSSNLLLLDEPTNHLDIGSRLTLEKALQQFDGAVVLVSHDRYFLDNVVTRVVEISNGAATSYPGNYEDYLRFKALQETASPGGGAATPTPLYDDGAKPAKSAPTKNPRLGREERKQLKKELTRAKKQIEELETRVMQLDEDIRGLENQMNDPTIASDAAKLAELSEKLSAQRALMEQNETEWTNKQLEAEDMEVRLSEAE